MLTLEIAEPRQGKALAAAAAPGRAFDALEEVSVGSTALCEPLEESSGAVGGFRGGVRGLVEGSSRGGCSKRVRYANFEQACSRGSSRRARGGLEPASSRTDPSRLALLEPCSMSARPGLRAALLELLSTRLRTKLARALLDQLSTRPLRALLGQALLASNHPVPAQLHSPSSPPRPLLELASSDSSSRLARSLAAPPARPSRCALATEKLMPCRRSTCDMQCKEGEESAGEQVEEVGRDEEEREKDGKRGRRERRGRASVSGQRGDEGDGEDAHLLRRRSSGCEHVEREEGESARGSRAREGAAVALATRRCFLCILSAFDRISRERRETRTGSRRCSLCATRQPKRRERVSAALEQVGVVERRAGEDSQSVSYPPAER